MDSFSTGDDQSLKILEEKLEKYWLRLTLRKKERNTTELGFYGKEQFKPKYNQKYRGNSRNGHQQPVKCFNCVEKGHFARNCPKNMPKFDRKSNNNSRGRGYYGGQRRGNANMGMESKIDDRSFFFGDEEANVVNFNEDNSWIVDSGASSHMRDDKRMFLNVGNN